MSNVIVSFTVVGNPKPAGSKRAFQIPSTGKIVLTDASKGSKPWKAQVAAVAAEAYEGDLLTGPLSVAFRFFTPRPRSHYGTGRNSGIVKAAAARWPITRPDVLKLARAVEDALTGVVWRDDAQIVEEHLYKNYGAPARVEVTVLPLERVSLEAVA